MKKVHISPDESAAPKRLSEICVIDDGKKSFDIELVVSQNARINLNDDLVNLSGKVIITLHENSFINYIFDSTKNNKNKNIERNLEIFLMCKGAEANVKFLCLGKDNRNYKFKTIQKHLASHTKSELAFKNVLFDGSKITCENLIRVEKNISNICAIEEMKSLLIGEDVKVVAIPKLEVNADDVSCRHGAAISQLDSEQLFYLQSRGMTDEESKKVLINSFLK
jgi:Fe-S cluster assembly scaffold protein SufB